MPKKAPYTSVNINKPNVVALTHQAAFIRIVVDDSLYLRDPQETELGRRLLSVAVEMIGQMGIEDFTFSKLARKSSSTEASVYRYFHNKHELLGYLVAWYWSWLDYQVSFRINNITDPVHRLEIILGVLAGSTSGNNITPFMNEELLHRLVVSESGKLQLAGEHTAARAYAHQEIFTRRIADSITRVHAVYKYPKALASLLIQQSHQQRWYADHFPELTEVHITNANS
ncbi:MAG: TetR/AcrR family transcriptional regulator, partial [Bacteroidia bacterium]